jgi:hypothetical protein
LQCSDKSLGLACVAADELSTPVTAQKSLIAGDLADLIGPLHACLAATGTSAE